MKNINKKGFTLVELLCVLVILAVIALIVGRTVTSSVKEAKKEITESQEKTILNATEKWAVDNSDKFDDIEGNSITASADIVFILDMSSTMNDTMDNGEKRYVVLAKALDGALQKLNTNHNRIAVIAYYNGTTRLLDLADYSDSKLTAYSTSDKKIIIESNGIKKSVPVSSGTFIQAGIEEGADILMRASNKDNRIPVMVLLTDGEPTQYQARKEYLTSGTYNCNYNYQNNEKRDNRNNTTAGNGGPDFNYWTILTANYKKNQVANSYQNSKVYFYTIGLDLDNERERNDGASIISRKMILYPTRDNILEGYSEPMSVSNVIGNTSQYARKTSDLLIREALCTGAIKNDNMLAKVKNLNRSFDPAFGAWFISAGSYNGENYYKNTGTSLYDKNDYTTLKNLNLKNIIPSDFDYYNYVDEYFSSDNADLLIENFGKIAQRVTDSTKVTTICVKVDELKEGGYLAKDAKIDDSLAQNTYVIVSEQPATNQYAFKIAKDEKDKQSCEEYFASQK